MHIVRLRLAKIMKFERSERLSLELFQWFLLGSTNLMFSRFIALHVLFCDDIHTYLFLYFYIMPNVLYSFVVFSWYH